MTSVMCPPALFIVTVVFFAVPAWALTLPPGVTLTTPLIDGQQLPPGCKPSTAEEIGQGFPTMRCGADRLIAPDQSVAAKEYLLTRLERGKPDYYVKNFNPTFAICLANFFKAAESAGYKMQVYSGARSPADQERIIKTGGGPRPTVGGKYTSRHVLGIAADIRCNGSSNCARMSTINTLAEKNGLHFRLLREKTKSGIEEPWHIEPKDSNCADRDYKPPTEPGFEGAEIAGLSPGDFTGRGGVFGGGGATGSFLSQMMQPLAKLFGQQQPQTLPTNPAPTVSTPSTPQVGDAFGQRPPTAPPPPFSTTTTSKQFQPLPDEKITGISVSAPKPTSTVTGAPPAGGLTQEELARLQQYQQGAIPPPPQATTVVINPTPITSTVAPYAGFAGSQVSANGEPSTAFLQVYVEALRNISRSLGEILRWLNGTPVY